MKVFIKQRYYKKSNHNRSPASFKAHQQKIGADVYATVKYDPVLKQKKLKDLRSDIKRHEIREIVAWGRGHPLAHYWAKSREGTHTRKMRFTYQFWNEVEKRERR